MLFQSKRIWIHPSCYLLFGLIICLFFVSSCKDDVMETTLIQQEVQSELTKSVVTVTICTDAFVEVEGTGGVVYKEYKGTTCRTCMIDDGSSLQDGEYYAGGFPTYGTAENKGGGGSTHTYQVGDNWHFGFPTLEKLYGIGSSLNAYQKGLLENVLSIFNTQPVPYQDLYNLLCQNNVKIRFKIDPSIQTNAQYNTADGSITFKNESSIVCDYLSEELIHLAQHQLYYQSTMNSLFKDYEFEAKVFHDFAYNVAVLYDGLCFGFINLVTLTDNNLSQQYDNW